LGILDRIERGLERAVNTAFAKTFRSGVQPVEITSALRRELDTQASVVARDRILVPNVFTVRLSRPDFDRLSAMGRTLTDEIAKQLTKHAQAQGYQFPGGIRLSLEPDSSLSVGLLAVDAQNVRGAVSWSAVLDINGKRRVLTKGVTVIGRGTDADITVNDSSISRRHVEFTWDGSRAQVRDLGSTNGSRLDGVRLTVSGLESGSVIDMGSTRVIFHVVPETRGGTGPAPRSGSPAVTPPVRDAFWSSR
jgi:hypothetical protein